MSYSPSIGDDTLMPFSFHCEISAGLPFLYFFVRRRLYSQACEDRAPRLAHRSDFQLFRKLFLRRCSFWKFRQVFANCNAAGDFDAVVGRNGTCQ